LTFLISFFSSFAEKSQSVCIFSPFSKCQKLGYVADLF